ncbi:hypothetical protein THRCLA_22114 [Thraustotheca clavata]|uniref:Uncharacterized protein n=1 Tax=Thraustotheca clavata TaxID=74557 RepID=A0A1V9ZCJ9_9STRA|nr:hypothetical protein THRCLA_22114 [Thraustotheca clavata]
MCVHGEANSTAPSTTVPVIQTESPSPATTAPSQTTTGPSPTITAPPTTTVPPPTTTVPPSTTTAPPPTTTAPVPTTSQAPATVTPNPTTSAAPTQTPQPTKSVTPPPTSTQTPQPSTTPEETTYSPAPTTTSGLQASRKDTTNTPAAASPSTSGLGVWPIVGIICSGAVVLSVVIICIIKRKHIRDSALEVDDPITPTHAGGAPAIDAYGLQATPPSTTRNDEIDMVPPVHIQVNELTDSYRDDIRPQTTLWESTIEARSDPSFISDDTRSDFDSFVSRSSTGNDTFLR